jgi:hypothetical protein
LGAGFAMVPVAPTVVAVELAAAMVKHGEVKMCWLLCHLCFVRTLHATSFVRRNSYMYADLPGWIIVSAAAQCSLY